MGKIQFIEESHIYLLDGVIIPSVSAIIRDDTYISIPPHILENARVRGVAVHLASEMIDLGKKPKLDPSFAEWVVQYCLFQKEHDMQWDSVEAIVYTDDYAGKVDRIGKLEGKILIADVKNTSKLYEDKIAIQLGGYVNAHATMNSNAIADYIGAVIWLKKDRWQFKVIKPNVEGFLERLKEFKEREVVSEINW